MLRKLIGYSICVVGAFLALKVSGGISTPAEIATTMAVGTPFVIVAALIGGGIRGTRSPGGM